MNVFNPSKMSKDELLYMFENKCKHGHPYASHRNCYIEEEQSKGEKVGFFDLECSALKADWGIILTWSILDNDTGVVEYDCITKKALMSGKLDYDIVDTCVETLSTYDRIVTYYGTGFDFPFIRTRALIHDIPFQKFGTLRHSDAYYMVRNKLCLSRNRLANAEDTLLEGKNEKTAWLHNHWMRAMQGNTKSLKYILDHNVADVWILKGVYDKMTPFVKQNNKSI